GGRSAPPEPAGLHVEHVLEFAVLQVHIYRGAGGQFELLRAADVIDVGVRDYDGGDREAVPGQHFQDAADLVAGIDHHGPVRGFVAENGAVALQHADGKNLVDHRGAHKVPIRRVYSPIWVSF